MRSHWPTAISTEPPCTQLTPSSANEHVENADTRGAEIAQNEPLPIDPLENADTRGAEIAQNEPLPIDPLENTISRDPKLPQKMIFTRDSSYNTVTGFALVSPKPRCARWSPRST